MVGARQKGCAGKLGRPNVKKAPEEAKHGLGHVTMDMMWKLDKPSQQTRLI